MAPFKRKIFYLSGFDPRGPAFYHRLMQDQAVADGARGGGIAIGKRQTVDRTRAEWTVTAPGVETTYVSLRWEDLVRAAWIRDPRRLVARGFTTYWRYLTRSDWPRVLALPRAPLTTLYYPLAAMVAVPLVLALLAGLALGLLLPGWAAALIGAGAGAVGAVPVLVRMRALWLVRLYVFNDMLARGRAAAGLDERLDRFADAIAAEIACADPADEILLVTHSNGSILAFPLLERLLARTGGTLPARFAVVTLAQCIPLVALRRDAQAYRRSIAVVAAAPVRWIDISFPPDGACYAGVDPFALARPPVVHADLTMLSPRFFRFNDPAVYEARRKQKYELHFEYLRTGQRPSPIDILGLVAAPHPIAQSIAAFRAIA